MKLGQILADNIRRLRNEQGLTQEELADRCQINRNYVGMIERRENSPTVDMLEKLAKAFNIPATSLLEPPERAKRSRDS